MVALRIAVALAVFLHLCVFFGKAFSHSRDLRPARRAVLASLPGFQSLMAICALVFAIVWELPAATFCLIAVLALACGPLGLVLSKSFRNACQLDEAAERVQMLSERIEVERELSARYESDAAVAARIRERVFGELSSAKRSLDKQMADDAVRDLTRAIEACDDRVIHACAHPHVDALVGIKRREAEQARVRFETDLLVPADLDIPSTELCALFSNLIDNSIKAACQAESGDCFVRVVSRIKGRYFVLSVTNSCQGGRDDGKTAFRRKAFARANRLAEEHGWGQGIVEGIARRRGGDFSVECDGQCYRARTILLMGQGRSSEEGFSSRTRLVETKGHSSLREMKEVR